MKITALICGGGNGAHVLAGLAPAQPDVEARVLTLFADEAERWTKAMEGKDFSVDCHAGGKVTNVVGKPSIVTKDPAKAAPGVDIIVFTVPAFAHAGYLEALKPYVKPGLVLVGCPGQAGFEFAVRGIWGEAAKGVTIMSFESLPWACRFLEFGRKAEVLGTKGTLQGAVNAGCTAPPMDATAMLQKVLGPLPKLLTSGHLIGITLMATNGYLHPSIMCGHWEKWDGKTMQEPPLFYNGVSKESAQLLSDVSDEVVATAKTLEEKCKGVCMGNVSHMYQWYLRCYGNDIDDKTDLYTCIKTNRAYKGLTHPCTANEDGSFSPNFGYRYMTEDLPFGIVVMRGVATIAGVPTPHMDRIIYWGQKLMGKEYLVDGELKGKDIPSTRSPQAYGINTLEALMGL
ncbi:hypothetical protein CAPTEDRAFT_141167 [Capitella teleta]|uniref:Opine dehydrogenase domain-containing protein n=1 Tax=Capitella teleta TaxID=283909 RepID=R7TM54_CAPTE|nr:hypothetical protein CAPTEDRAFT_141167 [Capitella teleta]|eukprot:ELT92175.1 hypothetical protein CAPTEDRAFT_141167 [Capitella teleta]